MEFVKTHNRSTAAGACLMICLCLLLSEPLARAVADEKMKPEEVVAKHLESIGSAGDRASVTTRVILGVAKYIRRGPGGGTTEGRVVLASENEKNMIGMKFGVPGYDVESMGFDGKNLTVGYASPGVRSVMEDFLRNHESTFKLGLLGGTLTSSWPLLALDENKAKVKYSGLKKIDGKQLHQLKYQPRKGSDLGITLFFDAETFRHVRTEYDRVVGAAIGTGGVDSSSSQREARYKLVEEFGDFKKAGNLILPHSYHISLEISRGVQIYDEWVLTLTDFVFNRPIDPNDYVVDVLPKR